MNCESHPQPKSDEIVAKKRGRKPKVLKELDSNLEPPVIKQPGKRGRKPKGGKIISQKINFDNPQIERPNIIVHLKCHTKDIVIMHNNINSGDNCSIRGGGNGLYCSIFEESKPISETSENNINSLKKTHIYEKLKILKHNLHVNQQFDQKSNCFWCSCEFDNPTCYIPHDYNSDGYKVYGCFCSPECATGYLFKENLDSSIKFERYYYLNHIYGKIFNYEKNIKPAPNPHYVLDKFCGNLTIDEYRALNEFGKLFIVIDKPLTPILPEIHEDNDDHLLHNKIIPSGTIPSSTKIK